MNESINHCLLKSMRNVPDPQSSFWKKKEICIGVTCKEV